jgi:hypothetical protein
MNHEDPKIMQRCALEILKLAKDINKLEEIRSNFKNSPTIQTLDSYCEVLSKHILL